MGEETTMNDRQRWYVTRDGVRKSSLLASANDAWVYVQKHQGMSVDWALKHEGWKIEGPFELQPAHTYGTDDLAEQEQIEAARVDAALQRRRAKG